MTDPAAPALFDQRPGDLEATRGLIPWPQGGVVLAVARNLTGLYHPGGWNVALLQDGAGLALMTPEQARRLADDLRQAADVCQGVHDAQGRGS